MTTSFEQLKEEAFENIVRYFREFGGEWGRCYLQDTLADDGFHPESAEIASYPIPSDSKSGLFDQIHRTALRIHQAGCADDLRDRPEDKVRRSRLDAYYAELMGKCDGTLLIIGMGEKHICCQRFARELAYGDGFVMRGQYYPCGEGSICECPDVLLLGYLGDGTSIHACPFCGRENLLYSAEESAEDAKRLDETVRDLLKEGRLDPREYRSYLYRRNRFSTADADMGERHRRLSE